MKKRDQRLAQRAEWQATKLATKSALPPSTSLIEVLEDTSNILSDSPSSSGSVTLANEVNMATDESVMELLKAGPSTSEFSAPTKSSAAASPSLNEVALLVQGSIDKQTAVFSQLLGACLQGQQTHLPVTSILNPPTLQAVDPNLVFTPSQPQSLRPEDFIHEVHILTSPSPTPRPSSPNMTSDSGPPSLRSQDPWSQVHRSLVLQSSGPPSPHRLSSPSPRTPRRRSPRNRSSQHISQDHHSLGSRSPGPQSPHRRSPRNRSSHLLIDRHLNIKY